MFIATAVRQPIAPLLSIMAFPNRLNSGPRHTSFGGQPAASAQSPMLLARINEKKAELENLRQLRDLSAGLATQMQTLQEKLSTLSNGTEGWSRTDGKYQGNLLSTEYSRGCRSLQLAYRASSNQHGLKYVPYQDDETTPTDYPSPVKIPKPKINDGGEATEIVAQNTLPQTLVRIPVEREPSSSLPQDGSDQEP